MSKNIRVVDVDLALRWPEVPRDVEEGQEVKVEDKTAVWAIAEGWGEESEKKKGGK